MKLSKTDTAKQDRLYDKMVEKSYVEPSRLSIQSKHLPEIKNWDVGKTYEIKIKAKMTSKSEGGYDGRQPLRAEFQIGSESEETESYDDD